MLATKTVIIGVLSFKETNSLFGILFVTITCEKSDSFCIFSARKLQFVVFSVTVVVSILFSTAVSLAFSGGYCVFEERKISQSFDSACEDKGFVKN